MNTPNLVLRTVYLSPSVDDRLRDEAYFTRTSKNDLIRRYIEAGMKALGGTSSAKKNVASTTTKKATPYKALSAKRATAAKKPAVKKAAAKKAVATRAASARP